MLFQVKNRLFNELLVDTGGIRTPLRQCKCLVLANYTTRPIFCGSEEDSNLHSDSNLPDWHLSMCLFSNPTFGSSRHCYSSLSDYLYYTLPSR